MTNKLFYRKGGTENFEWKPVLATMAEIPAKRMELFTAGYTTMIVPEDEPPPTEFNEPGAWPGKTLILAKPPANEGDVYGLAAEVAAIEGNY